MGREDDKHVKVELGTELDEKAKYFYKVKNNADKPSKNSVHIDLDKRCMICCQDNTTKHNMTKALKLACLKYNSSKVTFGGTEYERLKLIKSFETLVHQHKLQI
jgi:hypothetical protein